MGHDRSNLELRSHRDTLSNATNYHFHKHRGDAQPPINTLSPSMTQSEMDDVKTEAEDSQSAFNTECDSLMGGGTGWWDGLATEDKEVLRDIVLSFPC